jgi:hypothetical protein
MRSVAGFVAEQMVSWQKSEGENICRGQPARPPVVNNDSAVLPLATSSQVRRPTAQWNPITCSKQRISRYKALGGATGVPCTVNSSLTSFSSLSAADFRYPVRHSSCPRTHTSLRSHMSRSVVCARGRCNGRAGSASGGRAGEIRRVPP